MHDARTIANEFINSAAEDGNALTPMQLLKLVYIAHGWMLGLYGVPLVINDIEAWKYGPVIPDLYHALSRFRNRHITEPINDPGDDVGLLPVETDLLKQVYNIYGHRDGIALSRLTHQAGSPWHEVYEDGVYNIPIPTDIIENHYSELAAAAG